MFEIYCTRFFGKTSTGAMKITTSYKKFANAEKRVSQILESGLAYVYIIDREPGTDAGKLVDVRHNCLAVKVSCETEPNLKGAKRTLNFALQDFGYQTALCETEVDTPNDYLFAIIIGCEDSASIKEQLQNSLTKFNLSLVSE